MFTCPEKQIQPIILHTSNLTYSCCPYCHPSQNYKKLKFIYLFHIVSLSYLPDLLVSSLTCSIILMSVLQSCIQHFELFLYLGYLPFTFRLGAFSHCCTDMNFPVISFSFLLFQLSFSILQAESVHSSCTVKVLSILISFVCLPTSLSRLGLLLTVPFLPIFICLLFTGLFLILFYFLQN